MRKINTLILFITLVILFSVLGSKIINKLFVTGDEKVKYENFEKFNQVFDFVSEFYVDSVDWNDATTGAIEGMLKNLDPHSVYISPKDAQINDENFEGKYQGIGIYFEVIDGYLTVIAPISDSPSDRLGLISGDKIIKIDNKSAMDLTNSQVQEKLKGPKGSSVEITVIRDGIDEPLEFTIVRDEIPIYTINTSFLTDDQTGYIALNRFAKSTNDEIDEALRNLEQQGMKRLILDLRGNAGGYLDQAIMLASKFVSGREKIVSTKGRISRFNDDFFSDTFGDRKVCDIPLIVLINGASASASEIVAGAIQDIDRGLIVGTTSFGKGLVQREFPLEGESRLRLTISKYYTPSGRLIQRPYKGKNIEEYYFGDDDSLVTKNPGDTTDTRPVYYTMTGRKVFGGGGITPDTVIQYTNGTKSPRLIQNFFRKRVFFEVASKFAAKNINLRKSFKTFLNDFEIGNQLLNEIKTTARNKNVDLTESDFNKDLDYIKTRLKAEIARSVWDTEKYYRVILYYDNQTRSALTLFPLAEKISARIIDKTQTN